MFELWGESLAYERIILKWTLQIEFEGVDWIWQAPDVSCAIDRFT
jgi:hypothetical protein